MNPACISSRREVGVRRSCSLSLGCVFANPHSKWTPCGTDGVGLQILQVSSDNFWGSGSILCFPCLTAIQADETERVESRRLAGWDPYWGICEDFVAPTGKGTGVLAPKSWAGEFRRRYSSLVGWVGSFPISGLCCGLRNPDSLLAIVWD